MFDTTITGSEDNGTLLVKGALTMTNMVKLKEALLETMERFRDITVRIEQFEEVDFSCFQLFCAAHKSAVRQGKTVAVVPPDDDKFTRLLQYSGFAPESDENGRQTRGFILKGGGA